MNRLCASAAWTSPYRGGWQPARVQLMAAACTAARKGAATRGAASLGCSTQSATQLPQNVSPAPTASMTPTGGTSALALTPVKDVFLKQDLD